jgi:membrane associated rhomboid family serine protease
VANLVPSPAEVRARQRRPIATYTIVAINAAVFLYGQTLGVQGYSRFLLNWALIPARFTRANEIDFTGLDSPRILTVITSLFLHSGIAHIGLNMLLLYAIGRMVELTIGTPRFVLLYGLAGLGSSLAVILLYRNSLSPFIGASGAVYGVMGGYFLLLPPGADRVKTIGWTLALILIPALIPADVVARLTGSSFLANIAHWGHVGGFLTGILVMYVMIQEARRRRARISAPPQEPVQP